MIEKIILTFFGLILGYLTYIIVKPLTQLTLLKMKHGKDIDIDFFPILGDIYYYGRALSKHRDIDYYRRKTIQAKPSIKFMVSNLFLDKLLITIVDPQLIKQFVQTPENYIKTKMLLFNDLVLSKGLIFTEDKEWKDQRKIVGQQFTFENLKCRIPIIKQLTQQIFSSLIKTDQQIRLQQLLSKITGEVVTQTFFGQEFINSTVNDLSLTDAVVEIITLQFELSLRRVWTHFRGIFYGYSSNVPKFLLSKEERIYFSKLNNLKVFIQEGIKKLQDNFEENEKNLNRDFIQIYLSHKKINNQVIDEDELLHQFITFTFGGTDTTSTLATMVCYVLSTKPNLQEEIRDHIKENVKSFDDLSHQDLPKLDKLNALLLEVLRVYPPGNKLIYRQARHQHQLGSFTLKPSYMIDCGILPVQQNPKYYDIPEDFNINRWLNNELKETHAFIPFSSGPRNCIGQHMALTEAKIMFTYLLLNYKLIPDPKRNLEMIINPLYTPLDDRLVHIQLL